jgi:hypothetical protein
MRTTTLTSSRNCLAANRCSCPTIQTILWGCLGNVSWSLHTVQSRRPEAKWFTDLCMIQQRHTTLHFRSRPGPDFNVYLTRVSSGQGEGRTLNINRISCKDLRGTDQGNVTPRKSYHNMSELAWNRENRRMSWNERSSSTSPVAFKSCNKNKHWNNQIIWRNDDDVKDSPSLEN